jgi:hypothetical protein
MRELFGYYGVSVLQEVKTDPNTELSQNENRNRTKKTEKPTIQFGFSPVWFNFRSSVKKSQP